MIFLDLDMKPLTILIPVLIVEKECETWVLLELREDAPQIDLRRPFASANGAKDERTDKKLITELMTKLVPHLRVVMEKLLPHIEKPLED